MTYPLPMSATCSRVLTKPICSYMAMESVLRRFTVNQRADNPAPLQNPDRKASIRRA